MRTLLLIHRQNIAIPSILKKEEHNTHAVSTRIANITPIFRGIGIQTVIIYSDALLPFFRKGFDEAEGGTYLIKPKSDDIKIRKYSDSAFTYSGQNTSRILKRNDISHLIVSGFNTGACVGRTVIDALYFNFNVCVLNDCVGQDRGYESHIPKNLDYMQQNGAHITSSQEALEQLNAAVKVTHPTL